MRNVKVLPPEEPLLEPQLERNALPKMRQSWWRWFRNLFGDVQDAQALALEALLTKGPDNQRQFSDVQILQAQRGLSQIGELERKVDDLTRFVFAMTRARSALVQATGAWTPADNSGAALAFTGVNAGFTQIGNLVFLYLTLTYPVTADGSNASIKGLPYLVPNQTYAQVPSIVDTTATIANEVVLVPAKNTFTATFDTGAPLTAVTNATLSGATISAKLIYPVG